MHPRRCVHLFVCATLLLSVGSTAAFAQGQKITRENREATADERDNPQERARWFLRGRTVNGKPAPQLLHRAYEQKLNHRRLQQQAKQSQAHTSSTQSTATVNPSVVPSTTSGAKWIPLGPAPSGTASLGDADQEYGPAVGRTTVVVVDQSDTTGNTVYIGGAAGGLWKSTNAADSTVQNCNTVSISSSPYCAPNVTWTPLIDQQATLTVGAMAIQPGNSQWLLVGTGEANNSVDSYYGLGFLLSKDGGSTWTLISSAKSADGTSTIDLHGLGTTRIAFSTDNPNLVVASMAAASGGITVGAEFADSGTNTPRGLYFSTDGGQSWQRATVNDPRGTLQPGSSNTVIYNPNNKTFYADIRWHGLYSSTDGQNWNLLPNGGPSSLGIYGYCPVTVATNNVCPLYRSVLTQVPGRAGPNGKGEMYIFIVDANDVDEGIFQSIDGGATWTALSMTGISTCGDGTNGSCGTTQGSYNLTLLAVPNGTAATDIWAGAVNEYRCNLDPTLNPTCGAKPFYNMTHTYGVCASGAVGAFSHVHPDQHGIDFVRSKPAILYFGNDGGIYRTLNGFNTAPQTCGTTQPWVEFDNLSGNMGSMLQYVWFSQSPIDNTVLLGGTQDNGSMAKNSASPTTNFGYSWQSVNNGDGGFNDINPTNPNEWFTSSPTASGHVDVEQCINTSNVSSNISCTATGFSPPIVTQAMLGSDTAPFYMPFMLDPQAANHLLAGTCRLWRVDRSSTTPTSWPSEIALTYNLDAFSAQSAVACSASAINQVSAMAAGGPCKGVCNSGTNSTGNGSQVIYVGTSFGKLFVTTNADGGPSTWVDRSSAPGFVNNANTSCANNAPSCGYPISGIAIDPADPTGNTAFVTVMGFKTGHVFKTTDGGASFTNIDGPATSTGLPDNPADAVVVDPNQKGLVYVATDVGVFSSHTDSSDPQYAVGTWTEVGPSSGSGMLPNVATTALHTFGTGPNTRLRVSTYGRGIWDISIAPVPTFTLALSKPSAKIEGQSATITGTITLIKNYNYPITLSCTNLDPSLTCTLPSQPLAPGTASFTMSVTGTTAGTFNLTVTAVGGDAQAITQQATTTLTVLPPPDFTIAPQVAPATITTPVGISGASNFTLNANVTFNGTITLTCALPASIGTCSLSPASVTLAANGAANVVATVTPSPTAAVGTYANALTITAISGTISHQATATVQVLESPDFTISQPASASAAAGLTANSSFTLAANTTFNSQYSNNGSIALSCDPTSLPANWSCSFSPSSSITLNPSQQQSVALGVLTDAHTTPGTYSVTVIAKPTSGTTHSQTFSVTVQAPTNAFELSGEVQFPTPNVKVGATLTGASIQLRSSAYSGNVTLSCSQPTCALNPSTVQLSAGQATPVNVSFNAFGLSAGAGTLTVTASDGTKSASGPQPFAYNVTDYSVTAGAASAILPGGSTTSTISLAALSGYTGTVNASCIVQGTPLTCSLSPVGPYTVPGAPFITATINGPGSSTTTASGTYTVTLQTSDAGFASLAHNATIPVTIQDYNLTTTDSNGAPKTTATVTAGQSATFTVNAVAQAGGFTGNITLNAATVCSGLPPKSSCTLNGGSTVTLTAGGQPATLVITTTAPTTASLRPLPRPNAPLFAFWTMLPGAVGMVIAGKRRKLSTFLLLAIVVTLLIAMTACGGGGGSTTTPPPTPVPGTPAGTYTVTVTSSAGSGSALMQRSTQITLTVQ